MVLVDLLSVLRPQDFVQINLILVSNVLAWPLIASRRALLMQRSVLIGSGWKPLCCLEKHLSFMQHVFFGTFALFFNRGFQQISFYCCISWLIHVQHQTLDLLASTLLLQFVFVFSLQARMVIDETNGYTRGGEKRGYSRMRQRLQILLRDAWFSRVIFGFESIAEGWYLYLFLKALESPNTRWILLLEVRCQSRWIQK